MKAINKHIIKAVTGAKFTALLTDTNEVWYMSYNKPPIFLDSIKDLIDIAICEEKIVAVDKNGSVYLSECYGKFKIINQYGAISAAGCTGHWAVVKNDGSVYAWDAYAGIGDNLLNDYADQIEKWQHIKQIALTPQCAFGLTCEGEIITSSYYEPNISHLFKMPGKEIVQISVFGYRYIHTMAVLYDDGTVKGLAGNLKIEIPGLEDLSNIVKICCGGEGGVAALSQDGKLSVNLNYRDENDNTVKQLDNIADIDANFGQVIAVDKDNEIRTLFYSPLFDR